MGFLRRYVFHDIGLKLFALLMAVCLWAAVTQDHVEELGPLGDGLRLLLDLPRRALPRGSHQVNCSRRADG